MLWLKFSWSIQVKVMDSCMMAPSHYLKQCGLIVKLINRVPWHLYLWIIIKYLKIPIRKMRLKLVLWDNFTSSPEIIHFILSAVIIVLYCVMVVSWYLLSPFLICCLFKGNKDMSVRARGFEAVAENWVLDSFVAERILLPPRVRSAHRICVNTSNVLCWNQISALRFPPPPPPPPPPVRPLRSSERNFIYICIFMNKPADLFLKR